MIAVLYEDPEILILDKPPGLPVQPGEAVGSCLVDVAERELGYRPHLVHRLDRETCGCIIVARDARSAAKWSGLVASRRVRKVYRAVCSGVPAGNAGVFDDPLDGREGTQEAETSWRLAGSFGATGSPARFSLMELELGTGRMHQVRRHLAMHGLPILGDDRHGDFPLNKALHKEFGVKRLLLWARTLVLPGGIEVRSSVPTHFRDFLDRWPGAPDPDAPSPGEKARQAPQPGMPAPDGPAAGAHAQEASGMGAPGRGDDVTTRSGSIRKKERR